MSDLSQLQHELSVLEREHKKTVEAIHELREWTRTVSIEASVTRRHVEDSEKAFWRDGIARHQTELMAAQAKIAAVNKALREAKADSPPIRTLSQLPREVAINSAPPQCKSPQHNGETKPGRILFLEFFLQLCEEGLDPRQFRAFTDGAHQLVAEFKKTHGEGT
jgi:hypothetical protein